MDEVLAEQVEAFTSRFCRLQDTVGDKLLPAWLDVLGEKTNVVIDNLDKPEKVGVIASVDLWLELRQLRNQMIHEYIEDLAVLSDALQTAYQHLDIIISAAQLIDQDIENRKFGLSRFIHREQNPLNSLYFKPHDPLELSLLLEKVLHSDRGSNNEFEEIARNQLIKRTLNFATNYQNIVLKSCPPK